MLFIGIKNNRCLGSEFWYYFMLAYHDQICFFTHHLNEPWKTNIDLKLWEGIKNIIKLNQTVIYHFNK